jgi:hypothetical protein
VEVVLRKADDPRGDRWQGVAWEPWIALKDAASKRGCIPRKQGIYRVRGRRGKGLLYIGMSVRLAQRLHGLERAIHRADHVGHYAGGCVAHAAGGSAEVSWVVRARVSKRRLLGEEVDLIAAYRKAIGSSPRCQFAGERLADGA